MAEEDTVTVLEHTELDKEALEQDNMGGITPLPAQNKAVQRLAVIEQLVRQNIEQSRKFERSLVDNPNAAAEVQFRRYGLQVSNLTPVMIVKEKEIRGDTVITCYTDGATVYLGTHSGIQPGGSDTVAIVGGAAGAARTVRTKRALYAVCSADCVIDVQEEFNF